MIGIVPGMRATPATAEATPDHQQQIEGKQEAEAKLDHARQHLADVRRQEVEMAEEAKVEQRRLDAGLDEHDSARNARPIARGTRVSALTHPWGSPWLRPRTTPAIPIAKVITPG
jgi:hypothetical protein